MEVLVMKLSSRFGLDVLVVLGGAFLAIASMSFSARVAGWLGFGVSAGLAVLAIASAALTRSAGQRIGHSLLGLVGVWSLVAALVPSGTAQTWLVFADAVALGVIALADLTAHEATTENVVHRLEVTSAPASEHNGRLTA
jgi:hypothetical protein